MRCLEQFPPLTPEPFAPGTVHASVRGDATVVTLAGEHDLATLGSVRAVLEDATRGGGAVIVDLSPCAFIDCAVAHEICRVSKRTPVTVLVTDGAATVVRRLLELTGLVLRTSPPETISRDAPGRG